jgi:hypothetical protein
MGHTRPEELDALIRGIGFALRDQEPAAKGPKRTLDRVGSFTV